MAAKCNVRITVVIVFSIFRSGVSEHMLRSYADCRPLKENDRRNLTCLSDWPLHENSSVWLFGDKDPMECMSQHTDKEPACIEAFQSQISISTINRRETILTIKGIRTGIIDFSGSITCAISRGHGRYPFRKTVCDTIQIYALPQEPTCTIQMLPDTILLTCSTSKIYPKARFILYMIKDGGKNVELPECTSVSYNITSDKPLYFNSTCTTSIPCSTLQQGTYIFKGRIFPDVDGGKALGGIEDTIIPGNSVFLGPPQFPDTSTPNETVSAIKTTVGENLQFAMEIYSYPVPTRLRFQAATRNNLTASSRYNIAYITSQLPKGFLNVTIDTITAEDVNERFYTIKVDNGMGSPLVYKFYLTEAAAAGHLVPTIPLVEYSELTSLHIVSATIGVFLTVTSVILVVIVIVFCQNKQRRHRWSHKDQAASQRDDVSYTEPDTHVYTTTDNGPESAQSFGGITTLDNGAECAQGSRNMTITNNGSVCTQEYGNMTVLNDENVYLVPDVTIYDHPSEDNTDAPNIYTEVETLFTAFTNTGTSKEL